MNLKATTERDRIELAKRIALTAAKNDLRYEIAGDYKTVTVYIPDYVPVDSKVL